MIMVRIMIINNDNGKNYFHKLNCRLINLLNSNNNSNEKVIEMEKTKKKERKQSKNTKKENTKHN